MVSRLDYILIGPVLIGTTSSNVGLISRDAYFSKGGVFVSLTLTLTMVGGDDVYNILLIFIHKSVKGPC